MTENEIQALRDKRLNLWHKTKKFLDDSTDSNGQISQSDVDRYMEFEKEIRELDNAIELHTNYNQRDAAYNKLTSTPIYDNFKYDGKTGEYTRGGLNLTGDNQIKSSYRTPAEYHKNFFNAVRQNFRNNADSYLHEYSGGNGAFLVPSEMNDTILEKLQEENVMRQLSTVITTESPHKLNFVASQPSAQWINEGGTINFDDEQFTQITLDAHKLGTAIKISNELLEDSFYNLESFFANQFAQIVGNAEEDAFINGQSDSDVTNMPCGFLTTLENESDSIVTTATTDTKVSGDDIINLVYSVKRPYRKNAVFLMHDKTLEQIRRLKDNTQNYLWTPSLVENEPDRLLGHAVYTSAFFPTPTSSGEVAVAFGDFSRYVIADRGVRTFKPLRELFAASDLTAFLMLERVDGRLVDSDAIHILKIR